MISEKFKTALKLAPKQHYRIAQEAGIHPSTLSKLINGIEMAKNGDSRVIKIGKVLGLSKEELFEKN